MTRSYADLLARGRSRHGARFDAASLAPQFTRYYESGERIRVRFSYGEELTGTIGVTTGWRPCYLLMLRSNSMGSSHTLGTADAVVAVKRGREYEPIR